MKKTSSLILSLMVAFIMSSNVAASSYATTDDKDIDNISNEYENIITQNEDYQNKEILNSTDESYEIDNELSERLDYEINRAEVILDTYRYEELNLSYKNKLLESKNTALGDRSDYINISEDKIEKDIINLKDLNDNPAFNLLIENDGRNNKPDGHISVDFIIDDADAFKETISIKYYAKYNTAIRYPYYIPLTNTGYTFTGYKDKKTNAIFIKNINYYLKSDKVFIATFDKKDDIIVGGHNRVNGYVRLDFLIKNKDTGTISSNNDTSNVFINPDRDITFKMALNALNIKPMASLGYKFFRWEDKDNNIIYGDKIIDLDYVMKSSIDPRYPFTMPSYAVFLETGDLENEILKASSLKINESDDELIKAIEDGKRVLENELTTQADIDKSLKDLKEAIIRKNDHDDAKIIARFIEEYEKEIKIAENLLKSSVLRADYRKKLKEDIKLAYQYKEEVLQNDNIIAESKNFLEDFKNLIDKPIYEDIIKAGKDIISPKGYVLVKFSEGDFGDIEDISYYINPHANINIGMLDKPYLNIKKGFEFSKRDKDDDHIIDKDIGIKAIYNLKDDIYEFIPKDKDNPSNPDDPNIPFIDNIKDYFVVGFNTDGNGSVNHKEAISFLVKKGMKWDILLDKIKMKSKDGYEIDKWNTKNGKLPQSEEKISPTSYKITFKKKVILKDDNKIEDNKPKFDQGYYDKLIDRIKELELSLMRNNNFIRYMDVSFLDEGKEITIKKGVKLYYIYDYKTNKTYKIISDGIYKTILRGIRKKGDISLEEIDTLIDDIKKSDKEIIDVFKNRKLKKDEKIKKLIKEIDEGNRKIIEVFKK